MRAVDRVKKRAVVNVEFLIAAPARAGVEDRVFGFAGIIRVTRIYPAEIGQKRDQKFFSLVDAVSDPVNFTEMV